MQLQQQFQENWEDEQATLRKHIDNTLDTAVSKLLSNHSTLIP
jgi:hypothetical protein